MPRDGAPTRERILDAAMRLVIDNGFGATSVDAVLAASGSSKGAFFHHFPSKQALADALVERYVADDLAMLADGLAAAAVLDDPIDRAVAFVAYYEGIADDIMQGTTGCLYTSVLAEMQLIEAGTSGPIADATTAWRDAYRTLLGDALERRADGRTGDTGNDRRGSIDVDALADHVWVTFEGAFLLARTTGEPDQLRRQLAVLRQLVASLLR